MLKMWKKGRHKKEASKVEAAVQDGSKGQAEQHTYVLFLSS